MLKLTVPIALAASSVMANPIVSHNPMMIANPDNNELLCFGTIDISGYESVDLQGSPNNQTLDIFIGGGGLEVAALEWDLNLTTFGSSWAADAVISFENQLNLTPGIDDSFPVTNANYRSNGIFDLNDEGLPNIVVGADGMLSLEFFESFDDVEGETDAIWLAGSTITVYTTGWPTPGTASSLVFAGLITSRRKR
jgi:hypothetical protein